MCVLTQRKSLYQWWRNRHVGLCSAFHLSTSIPLHSLIGPHWIGCYSSTFFSSHPSFLSSLFPSSSSLVFSPRPPVSLFSVTQQGRKGVCGWVCVNPLSAFSSCSRLLFFFFFLFLVSQRGKLKAPFMYTEKDSGPILVSSIVIIHAEASWITLLLKEGQVVETLQRLKEASVSLVCSLCLCCHQWMCK